MNHELHPRDHNFILTGLPAEVRDRLLPHTEYFEAPLDLPMFESYDPIRYVYFPTNSLGSIVATTSNGQSCEIGLVGREGAVGLEVCLGAPLSPHRSMVQHAGPVFRIGTKDVVEEFRRCTDFHDRILHFVHKLSVQVSQTTLCNRLHTIDARLPRWLLMCLDRIEGDVLLLTQEFIALMLGTSRVTVTQAAQQLQDAGYIRYVRGRIHVLDRKGLESVACECYKIVKVEYDRAR